MPPFQPVGDRARWKVIYDLLVRTPVGEIVTYDKLGEILELHPNRQRAAIQMAVRRAAREHLEENLRALEVVTNQGYRIVEAVEQLRIARRYQRKANNALASGHSNAVNVDMTQLEPQTRHAFEVVGRAFTMQMDFNRRFEVNQQKLEENIAQITEQTTRSEEEIAALRARLERLERTES
jgi:SpoVK/Ycf46/Vps4 family AAA+-type ATPase